MHKAIVFNCQYNGLSIIQELGQHGIQCVAMDNQRSIGTYSKYAKYIKCPDPLCSEEIFIRFLYDYCSKQNDKPVLFPTNDHWAVALAKHKETLSEVSIPCVADWETIDILIHKNKFYKTGQERGYLTPQTWNKESLKEISDSNFPLVAKPIFRRISSNTRINKLISNMDRLRLTVLNTKDELNAFLNREYNFLEHLVFQEYIKGMSDSMYTVGIYASRNAEILGVFTGHKVRGYPAGNGDCVVGEQAPVPDYVIENTKRIVKDLHYTGIAEFEYKRNEMTGQYKLIEVNPRSWSWIGITPACGVSLPFIAYSDLSGIPFKSLEVSKGMGTVKFVMVLQDLQNSLFKYKHDYPKWTKTFAEWINDIRADTTIYAEFNAGDWLVPLIAFPKEIFNLLRILISYNNKRNRCISKNRH
jgi:predicted ATP-grasp superfamily ATP-dependent carboligase